MYVSGFGAALSNTTNSVFFFNYQLNYENDQENDDLTENEKNLSDFDPTIELFLMASYSADDNRPGEKDTKPLQHVNK